MDPRRAPRHLIPPRQTQTTFHDKTLIFSQPGALDAAGLEQVIEGVKNLDMAEVRAQAAQQQA